MDDLMFLQSRNLDCYICSVRANFLTVLTDSCTVKTSLSLCAVFAYVFEVTLSLVYNSFICLCIEISYKSLSDHCLSSFETITDTFYYCSRSAKSVTNNVNVLYVCL